MQKASSVQATTRMHFFIYVRREQQENRALSRHQPGRDVQEDVIEVLSSEMN